MTVGLMIFLALIAVVTVRVMHHIHNKARNIHRSASVADKMNGQYREMANDDLTKPGFDLLPGGSLNPHNDDRGLL